MEPTAPAPKYNAANGPNAQAGTMPWRVMCIVLGILFAVLPLIQNFLIFRPMLAILEFVPLSYYIKEMLPTLLIANATILAGFGFLLGGILLALSHRWGYILTVSASAFSLISIVEGFVIFLIVNAQSEDGMMPMFLEELYSMVGLFPVFVVLLEVVALILLNMRGERHFLQIRRTTILITVIIAVFLLLDMNICMLAVVL